MTKKNVLFIKSIYEKQLALLDHHFEPTCVSFSATFEKSFKVFSVEAVFVEQAVDPIHKILLDDQKGHSLVC